VSSLAIPQLDSAGIWSYLPIVLALFPSLGDIPAANREVRLGSGGAQSSPKGVRVSLSDSKGEVPIHNHLSNAARVQHLAVGHHGLVFINPGTAEVLHLVRVADLPKDISVRSANASLDYARTEVGGHTYLLPEQAEVEMSLAGIQTRNVVTFQKYRKFEAGSEITFGDKSKGDQ
jgi:hypothetical protein